MSRRRRSNSGSDHEWGLTRDCAAPSSGTGNSLIRGVMRLLVTGASGFIGRNLLLAVPTGWPVLATYNRSVDFVDFVARQGLRHVEPLAVDLAHEGAGARIAALSREFDGCVFLAANGDPARSVEDPKRDL